MREKRAGVLHRLLDLRIIRWQMKLVYAIVAYGIGFVIVRLITSLGTPSLVGAVVGSFLSLAAILLGARIFRVKGEAIAPPRAWWRMTGRAKLSRRVGVIGIIGASVIALDIVVTVFNLLVPAQLRGAHPQISSVGIPDSIFSAIPYVVIAVLYTNSANHLRKEKMVDPVPAPKFKKIS